MITIREAVWPTHSLTRSRKVARALTVTTTFVPDQALPARKVIGAEPVDAFGQARAVAHSPVSLADGRPCIAQVQIAMKMRLVDIDHDDFLVPHAFVDLGELFEVSLAFPGIGLAQQLAALLPAQPGAAQDLPGGVPTDLDSQLLLKPSAELLQGPPGSPCSFGLELLTASTNCCRLTSSRKGGGLRCGDRPERRGRLR